jgi:hypothetical protein
LRKVLIPSDAFSLVRGGSFKNSRMGIERKARQNNPDKVEITLDDIYNTITDSDLLKAREKQVEKDIIYINKEVKEILDYAHSIGKTIVLASDMYLDRDFIDSILLQNNIYYDKFFLSSEYQATKHSGELYKLIKADYPGKKILHFDDRKDLCIKAEACGINAIQVPLLREVEKVKYLAANHDKNDYSIYSALVSQNRSKNFWYNAGYEYVGITSLALIDMAIKNNEDSDPILFLARDMRIPYEIYRDIKKEGDPKGFYFPTNRWLQRCYTITDFTEYASQEYRSLTGYFSGLNIHDTDSLAAYIGIKNTLSNKLLKQTWIIEDTTDKKDNLDEFMLVHFNEIKRYCVGVSNNYEDYLKKFRNSSYLALDLGWQGTALSFFDKALIDLKSLNLFCALKDNPRIPSFYRRDESLGNFWSYFSINIMENFFIAPHESFKEVNVGFFKDVVYEDISNPHLKNYDKICKGARDFARDFRTVQERYSIDISFDLVRDIYNRLFLEPTLEEAEILGSVKHYNGTEPTYIAKPSELAILNPRLLCIELQNTTWRQGYVKILKDKYNMDIDNIANLDYNNSTDKVEEFVKLNKDKMVLCIGAGSFSEHLLTNTSFKDLKIIFLDNFRTEKLCGKQVLSLDQFIKRGGLHMEYTCIWTMVQTSPELEEQFKELNPIKIF